ncbi:MAG: cyclic nucleotide-binding domain-containing protein [Magnetococcales bacterium]|nr:cyclic nucleotide-binding domain-containing protein [Magnetococcales bacterium]
MREIKGLDTDTLLLIFRQIDFFSSFSDLEKRALIGPFTHVMVYDVGEYLIQEGSSEERSFFLLLSGGASVVKKGARIPLASLIPGDFFGEVSFLTDRVRTTNVIVHPLSEAQSDAGIGPVPHLFGPGLPDELQRASTTVLRFDPELMATLEILLRIKIKDLIIQHLALRVDSMHEQVVFITGQDPLLTVDPELEFQLREGTNRPVEERERTKDRLIEQLAEFLDELNRCLVVC